MQAQHSYKDFSLLLIGLALITAWRFLVASNLDVSLYIDEAQYWYWSQNLDFGYYSKPPMVALVIAFTTSLLGDSEFAIRLGSLLFYPLTSIMAYLVAARLYNSRVGLVSGLLFMIMPAVSLSSLVISTDVAFFFFWTLGLYSLIRALESNEWHWWILLGLAGGLGMQTKYTMGVFVFSALIYLMSTKQWKIFANPRLWSIGVLAALIWLPNLWWNSQHDYITFQHTYDISDAQTAQSALNFAEFFEFFGGQFVFFGIISFALLIYISLFVSFKHKALLLSFTWTFIAIISYQALSDKANANWAAPAYIAGTVMVAHWLVSLEKAKWLIAIIVLNLSMGAVVYYHNPLFKALNIEQTHKNDLYARLKGWPELGEQFKAIKEQYPDAILLGESERTILAHLLYQARPIEVATWNPTGYIRHHFDLHNDLNDLKERAFLFVHKQPLKADMQSRFTNSKLLGKLNAQPYPQLQRQYYVYLLEGFKGYTP